MDRITEILRKYISERIPKYATNLFWNMFRGIEEIFQNLEYRLDIFKRERNILNAQYVTSLRNLAAKNGFEPVLKEPSTGILKIKINPKLFNRVGYPLFLPPYSVLTNQTSKLNYYYNSNKPLRIDKNDLFIPVVEGELKSVTFNSTGEHIERIYLDDENISNGSVIVESNNTNFQLVKSFYDNEGLNNNRQFLIKYSSDTQRPIVLYIKGLEINDPINISYRLTAGEIGNINSKNNFETEDIVDSNGENISFNEDEIEIENISGFGFGSNGTGENELRAAIGFNHGSTLLFDEISYNEFIGKYSTILIQNIIPSELEKSIYLLYLSRRIVLNINMENDVEFINQYQNIITTKHYLLNNQEKENINSLLDSNEFALSSHVLNNPIVNKFAIQLLFTNNMEKQQHEDNVKFIIYKEFAKFFYKRNYSVNFELLFKEYMDSNKIKFEYTIFNAQNELKRINENNSNFDESYIINNNEYLPILKGDFNIIDSDNDIIKLFFDINIGIKN